MPEYDDTLGDSSLRDAFESFRAGSLPTVAPEGPDAVRHTVRRRHRARVTGVAVVTALVVLAGGASAVAALRPAGHTLPAGTGGSVSPTPSDRVTPSVGPEPSDSASAGKSPDGEIGATELMNATIAVPAWGGQADDNCSSGQLTFHNGEIDLRDNYKIYMSDNSTMSLPPLYFEDVDNDGAKETIVTLWCGAQGGTYQSVALDRDGSGDIVTLGQIASTYQDVTGATEISQVTTTAGGDVQLKWSRQAPGGAAVTQWRTYHWTGSGFVQVGGPSSLPTPSPTGEVQLTVGAQDVSLTANGDGTYGGTLAMSVTNAGTVPVTQFSLSFKLPQGVGFGAASSGSNGVTCRIVVPTIGTCDYSGTLPPGEQAVASATLSTTSSTVPSAAGTVNVYPSAQDSTSLANASFKLVVG